MFPACAGLDFIEDGRAFALADFDHDGRLEVLLKNRNAPQLRLVKNVMERLPRSIAFRLRGTKSNRDAHRRGDYGGDRSGTPPDTFTASGIRISLAA